MAHRGHSVYMNQSVFCVGQFTVFFFLLFLVDNSA